VVGFYGANTWLPGRDSESGFWAMIVVLILLSITGIGLVVLWQRRQADRVQHAARTRADLRLSSPPLD
jgi:hypothetical protein